MASGKWLDFSGMKYTNLVGEFLGTWLFMLSIVATGNVLVIGATLTLVIWLLSTTSGGHVNPAVSFGFYMKGNLSATEFLLYTLSQLLGATASIYTYSLLA